MTNMSCLLPFASTQSMLRIMDTMDHINAEGIPANRCVVLSDHDPEAGVMNALPPGCRIVHIKGAKSLSHMVKAGIPFTDTSDVFMLIMPGARIPQGFAREAFSGMMEDPGLAFYAHAYGRNARRNASQIRAGLRDKEQIIPQVIAIRASILEQVCAFDDGDDDFQSISRRLVMTLCRYFRCHLVESSEGRKLSLATSVDNSDMPESTPFEELLTDCAKYLGVEADKLAAVTSKDDVVENAGIFNRRMADVEVGTNEASSQAAQAIGKYYEDNDNYMNELVYWHCYQYWDGWWTLAKYAKGKALEYGGGLGTMSAIMAGQNGVGPVHYYDINRRMVDFVKRRMLERQLPIHVIHPYPGPDYHFAIGDMYDTIVAIDVIEHIPNWQVATCHLLGRLNKGGILIQHTNFGRTDSHPMHFDSNITMSEFLSSKGMEIVQDDYRGYKDVVWRKL